MAIYLFSSQNLSFLLFFQTTTQRISLPKHKQVLGSPDFWVVLFFFKGLCVFRVYFSLSLMTLFRGISDSMIGKCNDKNTPDVPEMWQRSVCQGGSTYEHKLLGAALVYESPSGGWKPCDYILSVATCTISCSLCYSTSFSCDAQFLIGLG